VRSPTLLLLTLLVVGCAPPTAPGGTDSGVVVSDGVQLQWYLDLPTGEGPFPAAVYGPGSGSVSGSHESTLRFARGLNDLGFAVMRYDKRGTGLSGGEVPELSTANSEEVVGMLAADMVAVLDQLLADDRIDTSRVGLFGASQANWYMPVVASGRPLVAFMVVVTGGVLPVGMQNRYEELTRIQGLGPDEAEAELGLLADFSGDTGFSQIPLLEKLGIPMLYLRGGTDRGQPQEANISAMEDLSEGGVDLEFVVYPEGEHLLPGIDIWPDVGDWLDRKLPGGR